MSKFKRGLGFGRGGASRDDAPITPGVIDGTQSGIVDHVPTPISAEGASVQDPQIEAAEQVLREIDADSRTGRRARLKLQKAAATEDGERVPRPSLKDRVAARTAAREERAAAKEGPATASEDKRLSVKVMIDFLQGVGRDEAVDWARRWAMTHTEAPYDCYYAVQKYGPKNGGGFAVEVQEGVGRSYLPSVLSLAVDNPGRIVVVPMSRRKQTIVYMPRIDDFDAQVLPEGQNPIVVDQPPLDAVRGPAMTPIMKLHRNWLISGIATAGLGMAFLLSSVGIYAFDPSVRIPPDWTATDSKDLPVNQWNRLQSDATDSYVVRMEYSDGQWRVIRQAVGSTAEVVPSTDVPGVPVLPAVPGAAGAIPAPSIAAPPPAGPPSQIPPPVGTN